ncbi:hypothetical protein [Herbaspirillum sp. meg3]|uniref:hypothetical protein n=1 Tax=Herbaspirillum sp. meg3 TaxID=2025949 RepID=UPI0012FD707B|nr:hypothetical protein [Herbaspirillum sp. meg3]
MKEFFCSLAMVIMFWIPATAAVITIAAAIPLKSVDTAISGAIGLLVTLLFRFLIKRISKEKIAACQFENAD